MEESDGNGHFDNNWRIILDKQVSCRVVSNLQPSCAQQNVYRPYSMQLLDQRSLEGDSLPSPAIQSQSSNDMHCGYFNRPNSSSPMNEMDHIANAANLNPQQQLLVINHLEELLNGESLTESGVVLDITSPSSILDSLITIALIPNEWRTPFSTQHGKIPRLLKYDVRRLYPAIFISILNGQREVLLHQYFKYFILPETNSKLLHDLRVLSDVCTESEPKGTSGRVLGCNIVVKYFSTLFESYADLTFTLEGVTLTRSNYCHELQGSMRMKIEWTKEVETVVLGDARDTDIVTSTSRNDDAATANPLGAGSRVLPIPLPTEEQIGHEEGGRESTNATCALPVLMQIQRDDIKQGRERCLDSLTDSTENQSVHLPAIADETRLVGEKIAYEVHAFVPFTLNDDWQIAKIRETTLSRSLES